MPDDLLGNHHGVYTGYPVCPLFYKVGPHALGNFGGSAFVTVPDHPALNFPYGDMSFDLWFHPQGTPAGSLVSKMDASSPLGWELAIDSTGRITLTLCATSCEVLTSTGPAATPFVWQFVGVTIEHDPTPPGFTIVTLYNNGVVDTAMYFLSANPLTPNGDLLFGRATNPAFYGQLDEIELFHRALEPNDFDAIYNADSFGKCRPQCTPPPADMVAWWTGDECGPTDHLGAHDGYTVGQGVCPADSMVNAAMGPFTLGFNSFHYVVPDAPGLDFQNGEMSLDLWLQPQTTGPCPIVSKVDSAQQGGWELGIDSSGRIALSLFDGTSHTLTSTGPLASFGAWQFVGCMVDYDASAGSATASLYNDGVVDSLQFSLVANPLVSSADLLIGADLQGGALTGLLDEIELFRRALHPSELNKIRQANYMGKCKAKAPRPFCLGDSSDVPCPCNNYGFAGEGCANAYWLAGHGGLLTASGSVSVDTDDLVLNGYFLRNQLPGQAAFLIADSGGSLGYDGIPFGDGRLCLGPYLMLLGVRTTDESGTVSFGPGLAAASGASEGDTRRFQILYRTPTVLCGGLPGNLTNGLEIVFAT